MICREDLPPTPDWHGEDRTTPPKRVELEPLTIPDNITLGAE